MFDNRLPSQQAFSAALCRVLRESRRQQKLTQAEVSARTHGLISAVALAGYETGHRAPRVQDLVVIASALGEDIGTLVSAAERGISVSRPATPRSADIDIDVNKVNASHDPRFSVVKRWIELRSGSSSTTVRLDGGAIAALSSLMKVRPDEARRLFETCSPAGIPTTPSLTTESWRTTGGATALPTPTSGMAIAGDSTGQISIRVSAVIASSDPKVQVLKSWVQMRLSQASADQLPVDAGKITGLSLLMDMSTTEVREFLQPFRQQPSRR